MVTILKIRKVNSLKILLSNMYSAFKVPPKRLSGNIPRSRMQRGSHVAFSCHVLSLVSSNMGQRLSHPEPVVILVFLKITVQLFCRVLHHLNFLIASSFLLRIPVSRVLQTRNINHAASSLLRPPEELWWRSVPFW